MIVTKKLAALLVLAIPVSGLNPVVAAAVPADLEVREECLMSSIDLWICYLAAMCSA
jgi:hypothetical protein